MNRSLVEMKKIFALTLIVASLALGDSGWAGKNKDFDIRNLPRLSEDLKPGTLAWATVDQLHPMQPQTGKREVNRKRKVFKELQTEDVAKFPKKLFKMMIKEDYIAPIFIGKTPENDSRYGKEDVL